MFLLGIDIAKLNHVASCIDSSTNEVVFSNFKFKNDFEGFSTLLDKIKTLDAKNDKLDSLNIAKSLIFSKLNFVSEKNIDCFSLKNLLGLELI